MAGEIVVDIKKRFPGGPEIGASFKLDLSVGRTTILFGPSGSGKTTVLRCIAGLERPDSGSIRVNDEIWFDGASGSSLRPQSRRVGLLFQDYALFPHLTVRENIEYGLDGRHQAEVRRTCQEMMRLFQIEDVAERKPRSISGGQAQRVALARAVAPQPRLLLLDEPLSALDSPTRYRVRAELRRLLQEVRLPTILVTHDRTEAIGLGDRMIVMAEGEVHQVGDVDEVFRCPASPIVARTMGVETILHGTVLDEIDGIARVAVGRSEIRALATEPFQPGDAVVACIRAEEVTLQQSASAGESVRNHFPGTILSIERDGPTERIALDCGFPLTSIITRSACAEMGLTAGSRAVAAVKATAVHLVRAAPAHGRQ